PNRASPSEPRSSGGITPRDASPRLSNSADSASDRTVPCPHGTTPSLLVEKCELVLAPTLTQIPGPQGGWPSTAETGLWKLPPLTSLTEKPWTRERMRAHRFPTGSWKTAKTAVSHRGLENAARFPQLPQPRRRRVSDHKGGHEEKTGRYTLNPV